MKFGLPETTILKLHSVFVNYPEIAEILIYGSRAKGNFREGSDIDISLKGKNLSQNILSELNLDIDDLNTPYFYDLSIYHKLTSTDLKTHIDKYGQVFYKRAEFVPEK